MNKSKTIDCLENNLNGKKKLKRAWRDEDDSDSNKEQRKLLKQKYVGIVGKPKWAKIARNKSKQVLLDDEDEDVDLLKYSGNLARTKKGVNLAKGLIGIKKLHNLNLSASSCGKIVKSVEFHPTSSLALIAGISGRASIVQVDGFKNEKLQSIKFQKFAIDCAHFTVDGKQFVAGSRTQRNFYCYDLMEGRSMFVPVHHNIGQTRMDNFCMSPDGKLIASCGKFGEIHLFTAKSKEWITTLKMNGAANSLTFTNDGKRMYSFGENGEIYEWDMNSRTCIKKFMDDGCLQGTSLALSGDNQYLAAGSSSGVVNLYKLPCDVNPKPDKTILNLVTTVSKLSFNKSSDILAMVSNQKNDAIKLLHVPSKTVFSNFPTTSDNVGKINCIDFSPNGGYLGLANNKAEALLYRLTHFENY
ncbi:U3 small nucleolar RNA-associated protein 18 homolog [Rhopalosiphum padi]|uniref:U3 small nucleolar RNA-associated protein 18 homolog n=1 Tax=Rhopalosiphum padi TaxID=40932 RepID=UPI00298DAE9B|nr:U3 small nucleolar RNA-associated protein 18 homolog [Rhopalosiphum padi]